MSSKSVLCVVKTICAPWGLVFLLWNLAMTNSAKAGCSSFSIPSTSKSPEEMAARIEVLEDRLSKSVNRNKELLAEIQKIRAESAIKYKQLQLDYERLAGAYQKETEKKIIRL